MMKPEPDHTVELEAPPPIRTITVNPSQEICFTVRNHKAMVLIPVPELELEGRPGAPGSVEFVSFTVAPGHPVTVRVPEGIKLPRQGRKISYSVLLFDREWPTYVHGEASPPRMIVVRE